MGAWPPAMQGAPFPRPVRSWALGGRPRRESLSPAAALGSGQPAGRRAGPGGAPGPGKMLPQIAGKGLAFRPRGDVRGRLSSQQKARREMRLTNWPSGPGGHPTERRSRWSVGDGLAGPEHPTRRGQGHTRWRPLRPRAVGPRPVGAQPPRGTPRERWCVSASREDPLSCIRVPIMT